MVDIWLILCQLIPFIEVLLHIFIDFHRDEDRQEKENKNHGGILVLKEADPDIKVY